MMMDTSSFPSSFPSSFGMRSTQQSIEIINGQRTVTTITTDESGNQTIRKEFPDGRIETTSSNISPDHRLPSQDPKRLK